MSYLLYSVAILAVFYGLSQYRAYSRLKQFKGPWSTGWSRLWLLSATRSGEMQLYFKAVNDQYGTTARIGPNYLITSDAALIKRMNAVRSSYSRSDYYHALRIHPTRDNITSIRDERHHDDLRHKMSAGYAGKENLYLEDTVDGRLQVLLKLIQSTYISSSSSFKTIDIARITTFFTLDTISDLAFGKTFGFLDRNDDPFDYIAQLKSMVPAMMVLAVYPELQTIVRLPAMQKLMPKATDAIGIGKVMGFARDVVAERFPAPGQKAAQITRQDMLGSFKDHGMTQEELESETLTQITAGSDSTATAIRMTLFHLAASPESEKRLLDELTAAGYGPLSAGEDAPILPDAEARKLPYLQACINEGLRMYPPVTGLLSKQSPDAGDVITVDYPDGSSKEVHLPRDTKIGWNPYGLLRSPSLFGADAEIWRPERWLEGAAPPSKLRDMNEAVGLVFGYGRFGCLGRPVAMLELNKAIPELLRRFKWQIARPEKPYGGICAGFWLHEDMNFVVTERVA